MTEKVLKQIRALDAAAEKAGGYVLPPSEARVSEKAQREFAAMRRYALKNKKAISHFTDEDFRIMGIERPRPI